MWGGGAEHLGLLGSLRGWEMHPFSAPAAFQRGLEADQQVF